MSVDQNIVVSGVQNVAGSAGILQKLLSTKNLLPKAKRNEGYSKRTLIAPHLPKAESLFFILSVKNGFVSEFINFSLI